MCQVHTGAHSSHYSRLRKTDYNTACHPGKTTTYILHTWYLSTHTHVRLKSGKKETKKRKKNKGKESSFEMKENKAKKERKGKKIT